jgi:hypothetical protein
VASNLLRSAYLFDSGSGGGSASSQITAPIPLISVPTYFRPLSMPPSSCPCISGNRGEWRRAQEPAHRTSDPRSARSVAMQPSFQPEDRSLKSTHDQQCSLLCRRHHKKSSPYEFSDRPPRGPGNFSEQYVLPRIVLRCFPLPRTTRNSTCACIVFPVTKDHRQEGDELSRSSENDENV